MYPGMCAHNYDSSSSGIRKPPPVASTFCSAPLKTSTKCFICLKNASISMYHFSIGPNKIFTKTNQHTIIVAKKKTKNIAKKQTQKNNCKRTPAREYLQQNTCNRIDAKEQRDQQPTTNNNTYLF